MLTETIAIINLIGAGLLAGEELMIRYGVRGPLASLEPQPHILLRQALIRRLRVLVPSLFGLTLLSGVAATALLGVGPGFALRCAGLAALVAFIGVTLAGTVPINQAALAWDAAAPPHSWRATIRRWEQLDDIRTWAALVAFALLLAAAMAR